MKYFIKVDYACEQVKTGGRWLMIEQETPPQINEMRNDLLPYHRCQRDIYSQSCEEDPDCNLQKILEIKLIE